MICRKCEKEVPDGPFCSQCGARQDLPPRRAKARGNGQGSIYQLPNGKYKAVKILGWYLSEDGKKRRRTVTKTFTRKKDAVNALPTLGMDKTATGKAERKAKTTLQQLYDLWLPTHRAGKDTIGNYKAAFNYFAPLYHERVAEIDIDDLQACIDDCPRGKSTKKNMRTTVGLMYKYGIPRGYFPEKLNLSDYLIITGKEGAGGVGLPSTYLETLRGAVGKVLYADYLVCQCYLGFRPSELLALQVEHYNAKERAFVGGAKTDAGKDRTENDAEIAERCGSRACKGCRHRADKCEGGTEEYRASELGKELVHKRTYARAEESGGCAHSVTDDRRNSNGRRHNSEQLLDRKHDHLSKFGSFMDVIH